MAEGPLQLQVEIGLEPDADAAELDEETLELRQELLELDVNAVERPAAGPPPEGARAIELALLGTLLVTAGQEATRSRRLISRMRISGACSRRSWLATPPEARRHECGRYS
jgi:hypothetical protein